MRSDIFIFPFNAGLWFILLYCVVRCVIWFRDLSRADKLRLQRGFFGKAFGQSIREIFMESLLHRKIFRENPLLGYMHMSLAFGWFLLILFGTIEADLFGDSHLNPPHKAIFFRYYNPFPAETGLKLFFTFLMDLLLAFILSGLVLAIVKRFRSQVVGMKKTTRHTLHDRVAMTALWLIFPSRLLAESFTSAVYDGGGFLTGSLGTLFSGFPASQQAAIAFWWLYSLSLGTFFILLPRTRYMHIPMELFLIFMRNSGITTGDKWGTYSEVEIHSCSSCGICINNCQMALAAGITDIQPAYLIKRLRDNDDINGKEFNCLLCGRCQEVCPVGIETGPLRMILRREPEVQNDMIGLWKGFMRRRVNNAKSEPDATVKPVYNYLQPRKAEKADVAFFAGCMTHLTPSVVRSMESIFHEAGVNYTFIDKDKGVCCGRPLMLAGMDREARELINHNSRLIWESGARTVVTPCPICYKVFNESYYLDAEIMHHSQYIDNLIAQGRLRLRYTGQKVVYHDPCELGRGSGVYEEPRNVIRHTTNMVSISEEEEMGLCCGGSLGNITVSRGTRRKIASDAADRLAATGASVIATGCPMCKKTFAQVSGIPVMDLAEITVSAFYRNVTEEVTGQEAVLYEAVRE